LHLLQNLLSLELNGVMAPELFESGIDHSSSKIGFILLFLFLGFEEHFDIDQ
jgi:hypothetical protein